MEYSLIYIDRLISIYLDNHICVVLCGYCVLTLGSVSSIISSNDLFRIRGARGRWAPK